MNIPQPLNGTEIKKGIAVRMTQGLPADVQEPLREQIVVGLGKTCSLIPSAAYAKFKAEWSFHWWIEDGKILAWWWVEYWLDDFGRITQGGIGDHRVEPPNGSNNQSAGRIDEVPPDRFRRETDQPIPKPVELKNPEPEKSSFSRSVRGSGKRREV